VDGDARSRVGGTQLWSSLRLGYIAGHALICGLASPAPLWLTRNGLVKRLLQAGLVPLQEVGEVVNARLAQISSRAVGATLAAFATAILCLDETRLDAVARYLKPVRGLSAHDAACTAFKLVGLLDPRGAQRDKDGKKQATKKAPGLHTIGNSLLSRRAEARGAGRAGGKR
jgi:hypothetical protein